MLDEGWHRNSGLVRYVDTKSYLPAAGAAM